MNEQAILKRIQALEIKVALEMDRICEKYGIKYFMTAGTVLGAVRHKGFIPWDDDMDFGMLRDDYEKFIEICSTELGKDFFLQTWDTDKEYPFSYAKLRLNGTKLHEAFYGNCSLHQGIGIDIFPFDNVPEGKIAKWLQSKKYYILKRMLWIKKDMGKVIVDSKKTKLKFLILKFFAYLWKFDTLKNIFLKTQKKYNNVKTDLIVADGSYSYNKETIKREWIEELVKLKFENVSFFTYANPIEYLISFYGDYNKLPPVGERNRHRRMDVDFGSYDNFLQ